MRQGPTRTRRRATTSKARRTRAARPKARRRSVTRPGKSSRSRARSARRRSPARRSAPRASRAPKLFEVERALRLAGFENVRRGTIVPVGSSAWVTPRGIGGRGGKGGLGALDREFAAAAGLQARALKRALRRGEAPLVTVTARVRLRGKDGKLIELEERDIALPRVRDVRRRRGESLAQAMRRAAREQVLEMAYGAVRREWGKGDTNPRRLGEKMGAKRARAHLRRVHRERGLRVKVTVNRVVA